MSDTIAAVATGNAVSAIGIIRISGDDAIRIADAVFTPRDGAPMSEHESRLLVLGTLRDASGRAIDECMCTVSRAPRSYTGEDTAELQCHGSPTVLRCALEALFANGARQARAGEFTKRAFLNGRMDLTSAEAVADLIEARSAAAAHNAAAQLGGAISRAVEDIYSDLVDIMSHYHAVLDWSDEDIEPFEQENYIETLERAVKSLRSLLSTFGRGRVLREGVPAAIIGLPNAGKSSLLNVLLGYDRAIVTSAPGTTRDTITESVSLGGVLLRLTDTAGQREALDDAERQGVERSRAAARDAELVLGLIDGSVPPEPGVADIIAQAENAPHGVIVLTKSDLPRVCGEIKTALPTVRVSSVTGEGTAELERLVAEMFPVPETPAGEILTNARQAEAVGRAVSALEAARDAMTDGVTPDAALTGVEDALGALSELTGRTVRDDVVERIFSRFCVGK